MPYTSQPSAKSRKIAFIHKGVANDGGYFLKTQTLKSNKKVWELNEILERRREKCSIVNVQQLAQT